LRKAVSTQQSAFSHNNQELSSGPARDLIEQRLYH